MSRGGGGGGFALVDVNVTCLGVGTTFGTPGIRINQDPDLMSFKSAVNEPLYLLTRSQGTRGRSDGPGQHPCPELQ